MIDPTRASFVSQEYRYVSVGDEAVRTRHSNAREIVLDTNLDQATATQLASDIFAANDSLPMVFQVEIEGAMDVDELVGSVPRFTLKSQYPDGNRVYKLVAVEIDYENELTNYTVRG